MSTGSVQSGVGSPLVRAKIADVSYVQFDTFVHDVAGRDDKELVIRDRALVREILEAFQDACKRPGCPGEHWDGAGNAPDDFIFVYRSGFGVEKSTFHLHLEDKVWGPRVAALYRKLPLTDLRPKTTFSNWPITAVATGSDRVALYWQTVPHCTGYRIYRADDPAGTDVLITPRPVTPIDKSPEVKDRLLYLDRGLKAGRTYAYRVTALFANGKEATSYDAVDTTGPDAIPFDSHDPSRIMKAAIKLGRGDSLTSSGPSRSYVMTSIEEPNGTVYTCGPGGRNARSWRPDEDYIKAADAGTYSP